MVCASPAVGQKKSTAKSPVQNIVTAFRITIFCPPLGFQLELSFMTIQHLFSKQLKNRIGDLLRCGVVNRLHPIEEAVVAELDLSDRWRSYLG
jgi:hypothetical protein